MAFLVSSFSVRLSDPAHLRSFGLSLSHTFAQLCREAICLLSSLLIFGRRICLLVFLSDCSSVSQHGLSVTEEAAILDASPDCQLPECKSLSLVLRF